VLAWAWEREKKSVDVHGHADERDHDHVHERVDVRVDGHAHAQAHDDGHGHGPGHEHVEGRSGTLSELPFAGNGSGQRSFVRQVLGHFDELLYHVGAWTLVGLLAAAYLQATVNDGSLSLLNIAGADILLVSILAVPSYVCAASATPLAAVLLTKGVSQGAVLTGLLLGPATNVATLAWMRAAYGARATAFGLGALVLTTWALALAANAFLPVPVIELHEHAHEHGLFAYACVVLLVLLLVRAVWRNGLRVWLGSLGEAIGHDHKHDHTGHAHG
jgi:hypothetical protein